MAKRHRKNGSEAQAYDGQSRRSEEVHSRIRLVMRLLRDHPCLSVGEVAEHFEWPFYMALYTLEAAWSDGLIARCRAKDIEGVGGIGVPPDTWLYERVAGVRILRSVA